MANGKKTTLSCQNCRTPIDIDPSLDQLNPAAFKLLTDSITQSADSKAQGSSPSPKTARTSQSRPAYPSSRYSTYNDALRTARNPTFKRSTPSGRFDPYGANNAAMSFINVHMSESMLDTPSSPPAPVRSSERQAQTVEAQTNTPEMTRRASAAGNGGSIGGGSLADGLETTKRMFEILSSRSDIDHPICSECTELLVDGLQKRLAVSTRERDAYIDYLRRANTDVPSAEEIKAAEAALKSAREKEAVAIAELERLEAEKADIDAQFAALEIESRKIDQEESKFWQNRNAFATQLSDFQSARDGLMIKHSNDTDILRQLQRRSVYNDTFNITHDNHFATINGLRLGRLPAPYVDWPELNAAWGQTCLLLATLAERLGFKFQGYELCPMGSSSTIIKTDVKGGSSADARQTAPVVSKQRLELYSSGDFPINFGFMHRKFDSAMVAFLECLRQLGEFVENQGTPTAGGLGGVGDGTGGMRLPYEIRKDKIHDQSIQMSKSKDEAWTKACKYTLTCCKFLLAHANNMDSHAVRRGR